MLDCRYRGLHLWLDDTVGFLSAYQVPGRRKVDRPLSAYMMRGGRLLMQTGLWLKSDRFLCERSQKADEPLVGLNGKPETRRIQLSKPNFSSDNNVTRIVCPSGHWAHKFLACDARSVCWQKESFLQDSGNDIERNLKSMCESALSPLFACRTGVDRVSYSLVCDHNQDCLDASDEDFCVYPSCSIAQQLECSNRQVLDIRWGLGPVQSYSSQGESSARD